MITFSNENYCEYCFERIVHRKAACPACGSIYNDTAYHGVLPVGSVLAGRYAVGKVLGKGGFGVTYLCFDIREKKRVAIKEYLPDSLSHRNTGDVTVSTYIGEKGEQFRIGAQKFYEEARLVSHFNGNPNIISVHEFFYENNTTYFVMEYLSGTDIKGYLRKHPQMSEKEAMYIAQRALDALLIVHSTNTIHRDIAPDNIFLCDDGSVKLIDFGAARHIIANESKSLSVILKHGFAPLEQYQSKGKQGPWTDIYALGVTLYFAIKNRMPDDAMSRLDDPSLDMSGISPAFAAILNKMMAPLIKDRYTDVFSLKRDLDALQIEPVPPCYLTNVENNYFYCSQCGKMVEGQGTICEACSTENKWIPVSSYNAESRKDPKSLGSHFCTNCGKTIVGEGTLCDSCANQKLGSHAFVSQQIASQNISTMTHTVLPKSPRAHKKKKNKVLLISMLSVLGVSLIGVSIALLLALDLGHTHTFTESYVTKLATCDTPGERTYYCSCGDTRVEKIEALNHVFTNPKITTEATCSRNGVRTYYCSCGAVKNETLPKTDSHVYNIFSVVKEPTCTAEGVRQESCSCGARRTATIPKSAHTSNYSEITKNASCNSTGTRTYYCICGTKVKTETIPKTQHNFSSSKVTKEATYSTEGVRTYYCSMCGSTTTESIPKLEADFNVAYDAYERGDYSTAVSIYSVLAEQGDQAAQNNLALCYEYGRGVSQNYYTAVYWYQKSAEQGNKVAQNNLANCYFYGRGVAQNYYTAVSWYQKSADQGNVDAQSNLGWCYLNGHGVALNYKTAVYWLKKAADQGQSYGQLNLGYCYEYGYGVTQNYYTAVSWYQKSANQGNDTAQCNLGLCYYYGRGVAKNYNTAKSWFQMAANQGNQKAIDFLNNNY